MKYMIENYAKQIRRMICFLSVLLTLCSATVLAACSNDSTPTEHGVSVRAIQTDSRLTSVQ